MMLFVLWKHGLIVTFLMLRFISLDTECLNVTETVMVVECLSMLKISLYKILL